MGKITYADKEALNEIPSIANINKCRAADMNEIKNVVNTLLNDVPSSTAPANPVLNDLWIDTNADEYLAQVDDEISTTSTNAVQNQAITNAFGGILLWTNPNPTSNFAAQTITISSTDYDVLEIFYMTVQSTNNQLKNVKTIKNYNVVLDYYDGYSSKGALRTATIIGDQITFSNSFYDSITGSQNYCIPIYIIGYKTGITF